MEQQHGRKSQRDTGTSSEYAIGNIDPDQIYKVVQEAFGDLNATYTTVRKQALEMISNRPFYALASAAVIGLAAGLAFRNQIVSGKNETSTH